MSYITIKTPIQTAKIPNSWDKLTPEQFQNIIPILGLFAQGTATKADVQIFHICNVLGINPQKIKETDTMANIIIMAEKVNFMFNEHGNLDITFAAQLIPKVGKQNGYTVRTDFDTLTCSLTASQFIDAQEIIKGGVDKLPLLASILYCPSPYKSEKAHSLARNFRNVNLLTLQAIAVNFQALVSFLFTRTHFSILSQGTSSSSEITTGLTETMYNLSTDGYGNIEEIKQMKLIEFLTILRKKLIDSIQAMHAAKMDIAQIAIKSGLHSTIIKKIIHV